MDKTDKKIIPGGVTERWIYVTLIPTVVTVFLACVAVFFVFRRTYYFSAEQAIQFRISSTMHSLPSTGLTYTERYSSMVDMVQNYSEKDKFELMLLSRDGTVLVTSSGFSHPNDLSKDDFNEAYSSDDGYGSNIERSKSGEHVISVTQMLGYSYGDAVAIRFVSSLRLIDRRLGRNVVFSLLIGLVMVSLVSLTGSLYLASLKGPMDAIGDAAKLVAAGQFDTRIDNVYSGEFSDLCDIVNNMASELERTNNLKNDFVSSISHELRTPLTSIKGWSDTISSVSTDDELYKRGLNIISSETERLSGLVEDLLDFSRLESHRELTHVPVMLDLGAELSDAVLTLEQRAQKQGVLVKYSEPDYPVIVNADKNRLRQVFTNVFDNALKYSPRKKTISIKLTANGDEAVISVRDRGPGIPKDEIPKVTERYYRASNSVYGTGIGLSLVDEIMRAHGGSIKIQSDLGHGTTVFLYLPIHNTNQSASEQ